MPRNNYPGKKNNYLVNYDNYYETSITFDIICNNKKIQNIKKPNEQGSLDLNRVSEMVKEYSNNPQFLKFKNRIVIGDLNNTWYIIDGQHRLEMVHELYNENKNIEDELTFCWYKCKNECDMRTLFNSINYDSTKNKFYIQLDEFNQIKVNEFMKLLKKYNGNLFVNKKSNNGHIYTIEEVRDKLIDINYFTKNNKQSSKELYDILINYNNTYFLENRYEVIFPVNRESYYKEEHSRIENKFIIPLKKCNFFKWIEDSNKNRPCHIFKKGKKRINRALKLKCWNNLFGNQTEGNCPIPNCSLILKKNETDKWNAGHIISEYNGGETIEENLNPICKQCNSSMGSMNWDEYVDKNKSSIERINMTIF